MARVTPDGLAREARRRFVAATGQQWQHASLAQRRKWCGEIEPTLRAEHGIAADAVYRDGAWQPPGQLDLLGELNAEGARDGQEAHQ